MVVRALVRMDSAEVGEVMWSRMCVRRRVGLWAWVMSAVRRRVEWVGGDESYTYTAVVDILTAFGRGLLQLARSSAMRAKQAGRWKGRRRRGRLLRCCD